MCEVIKGKITCLTERNSCLKKFNVFRSEFAQLIYRMRLKLYKFFDEFFLFEKRP